MTDEKDLRPTPRRGGEIVSLVVSVLQAQSVDPAPVLARAGLAQADLDDPKLSVPADAAYRLIEYAAEVARDPAFGLHLVDSMEPRAWGLFYYLTGSAPTVRGALAAAARNMRLANPAIEPNLVFRPDGGAVWENRFVAMRRSGLKHSIEFVSAHMTRLLHGFAGHAFRLSSVEFAHGRAAALYEFRRYFDCPVTFGAPADRVTFPKETLDLPLLTADAAMHGTLERLAQKAAPPPPPEALAHRARVEAELLRLIPGGNLGIDPVAAALGMSARSLTRRLAAERTSYSAVLDDVRRTLALQYFARQDLTVGRIAYLVGYDDPGAFTIAFRRWTGTSPSHARSDPALLERLAAPGPDKEPA